MSVFAVLEHVRDEDLTAVEHAVEIDAQHPVPRAVGYFPAATDRAVGVESGVVETGHAGVVAEDVDVAELGDGLVSQVLQRLAAHRVDDDAEHVAFFLAKLLHLNVERVLLDIGENHVHTLGGEAPREREPYAARRTGDDRSFTFEFPHVRLPDRP